MMVRGQSPRHQSNDALAIPPCFLYDLIRRPMKVDAIDVGGFDQVPFRCTQGTNRGRWRGFFGKAHTRGEVGGSLRLGLIG